MYIKIINLVDLSEQINNIKTIYIKIINLVDLSELINNIKTLNSIFGKKIRYYYIFYIFKKNILY